MSRQQATNRELGIDTARLNLLTNPNMEIWQRGTGPFTTGYAADCWQIWTGAGATITVSRTNTIIPATGSKYSAVVTVTGTAGPQLGSYYNHMVQEMGPQLRGQTVTFSALVHSVTPNMVFARTWMVPGTLTDGAFHTGDNTWQWLTATCVVDPGVTSIHPELVFKAPGTVYVNATSFVIGSVAGSYAPLHPADDLVRCMRYYEVLGIPGAGDYIMSGYSSPAQNWHWVMTWEVPKVVTPTATKVGTWSVSNASQPTLTNVTKQGALAYYTPPAAGNCYVYNSGGGACFTIEANP